MKRPLLWSAVALALALCLFLLDGGEQGREAPLPPEPGAGAQEPSPPAALSPPERPAARMVEEEAREEVPAVTPSEVVDEEEDIVEESWPPEEIEEAAPPPDPIELGECTLLLELVDRETLEYVESTVLLWRLDAPENEDWTSGDQLQTTVQVPREGVAIRDLPEGRYRARVTAELRSADDPPEFEVSGRETLVRLELSLPRSFPVTLRLFDETGTELRVAEGAPSGDDVAHFDYDHPGWLKRRELKRAEAWSIDEDISGFTDPPFGFLPLEAGPDGFSLGDVRQESRGGRQRMRWTIRIPGRSEVELTCDGRGLDAPARFVGVAIDRPLVLDSIFLPDGTRDPSLSDRVRILSAAIRVDESTAPESWRTIPVAVHVEENEACEALYFEFQVADLPLPDCFLVAE